MNGSCDSDVVEPKDVGPGGKGDLQSDPWLLASELGTLL